MAKALDDVVAADPLALAPRKKEYFDQFANPMAKLDHEQQVIKEQRKALQDRLTKLWKLHPAAHPLADKLAAMKPEDRVRVLKGAALVLKHRGQELPEDLFNADGLVPGAASPEGFDDPVMDGTPTGKATARKPRSKREPDAGDQRDVSADTAAIPLEDAQRAFEENAHKAPVLKRQEVSFPTEEELEEKAREIAAQQERDAAAFDDESEPEPAPVEAAAKKRSGRKPGSKNKPKVDAAPDPVKDAADRAEQMSAAKQELQKRAAKTEEKVEAVLNEPPQEYDIEEDELDEPPKWAQGNVRPIGRAAVEF